MNAIHSQQALDPDTMVQEYRVDRVLGMGSLGIVYAAENTYFNEMVALKEFLPSNLACRRGTTVTPLSSEVQPSYDWALKKFLDEARTLRELCHPEAHRNIVRVRQFIEQNDTAYMVMDYEKGHPFATLLEERRVLPEAELNEILQPLLDGLERIHAANIWHRDIKPSNILIRPDNSPVLIDFGAARHEVVGRDPSVMSQYTPGYAAIEQFHDAAEQGPWTDIFAMGGTLYRAVTGRKPAKAIERFVDENVYVPAMKAARGTYTPAFLAAIDAALTLKPEGRPQSIAEWRRWFDGAVTVDPDGDAAATVARPRSGAPLDATMVLGAGRKPVPAPSDAAPPLPAPRRPIGRGLLTGVVVVCLAALVAGIGTLLYQRQAAQVGPTSTAQPPAPPIQTPDLAESRDQVDALLSGLECASTQARLTDDGTLSLSGFVASPADLSRIQGALKQIDGIAKIEDDLAIQPWPFCEILRVLLPLKSPSAAASAQPQLQLNKPDRRYRTGDKLVVTATAGRDVSAYLYVDYIDSDGSVVHLLPSPRQPQNRLEPGQKIVLGALDAKTSGDFVYAIEPPLGPGMVIAYASRHQLLEAPRQHVETTGEYVPALQAALQDVFAGEPEAGLVSTHTLLEIYE
ncbi:MAG: serine/threonine-protein kinase [Desulfosarcinaceae bacterium]|nr:serine/threonine-protein kinase [Desulfosarcinaceae bacterium]